MNERESFLDSLVNEGYIGMFLNRVDVSLAFLRHFSYDEIRDMLTYTTNEIKKAGIEEELIGEIETIIEKSGELGYSINGSFNVEAYSRAGIEFFKGDNVVQMLVVQSLFAKYIVDPLINFRTSAFGLPNKEELAKRGIKLTEDDIHKYETKMAFIRPLLEKSLHAFYRRAIEGPFAEYEGKSKTELEEIIRTKQFAERMKNEKLIPSFGLWLLGHHDQNTHLLSRYFSINYSEKLMRTFSILKLKITKESISSGGYRLSMSSISDEDLKKLVLQGTRIKGYLKPSPLSDSGVHPRSYYISVSGHGGRAEYVTTGNIDLVLEAPFTNVLRQVNPTIAIADQTRLEISEQKTNDEANGYETILAGLESKVRGLNEKYRLAEENYLAAAEEARRYKAELSLIDRSDDQASARIDSLEGQLGLAKEQLSALEREKKNMNDVQGLYKTAMETYAQTRYQDSIALLVLDDKESKHKTTKQSKKKPRYDPQVDKLFPGIITTTPDKFMKEVQESQIAIIPYGMKIKGAQNNASNLQIFRYNNLQDLYQELFQALQVNLLKRC